MIHTMFSLALEVFPPRSFGIGEMKNPHESIFPTADTQIIIQLKCVSLLGILCLKWCNSNTSALIDLDIRREEASQNGVQRMLATNLGYIWLH